MDFEEFLFNKSLRATHLFEVAVTVLKSNPKLFTIRIKEKTAKITKFSDGCLVRLSINKANRTIVVTLNNSEPFNCRKVHSDRNDIKISFPRDGIFQDWFPICPMRGMKLVEVTSGKIIFSIPEL